MSSASGSDFRSGRWSREGAERLWVTARLWARCFKTRGQAPPTNGGHDDQWDRDDIQKPRQSARGTRVSSRRTLGATRSMVMRWARRRGSATPGPGVPDADGRDAGEQGQERPMQTAAPPRGEPIEREDVRGAAAEGEDRGLGGGASRLARRRRART